ncbi:hypothetical protein MKX01_017606 [Papaver californicum]|nr:hypothetical protein MKX01_017606 [Papaver californicum]
MSCCGGSCGCGSSCQCTDRCNGCGMYPDFAESSNTESLIFGLASQKSFFEGFEMGVEGGNGGGCGNSSCSCGDSCKCGSGCKCGK